MSSNNDNDTTTGGRKRPRFSGSIPNRPVDNSSRLFHQQQQQQPAPRTRRRIATGRFGRNGGTAKTATTTTTTVRKGVNSRAAMIAAIQASRSQLNEKSKESLDVGHGENGGDGDRKNALNGKSGTLNIDLSHQATAAAAQAAATTSGKEHRRQESDDGSSRPTRSLPYDKKQSVIATSETTATARKRPPQSRVSNSDRFASTAAEKTNTQRKYHQVIHQRKIQRQQDVSEKDEDGRKKKVDDCDDDEDEEEEEERRLLELRRLAYLKRENHHKASQCLAKLYESTVTNDIKTTKQLPKYMQPGRPLIKPLDLRELLENDKILNGPIENEDGKPTSAQTAAATIDTTKLNSTPITASTTKSKVAEKTTKSKPDVRSTNSAKRKQFLYDPLRKWTKDYFVDPFGSQPPPNDDASIRRMFVSGGGTADSSDGSTCSFTTEDEVVVNTEARHAYSSPFFHETEQPFTIREKAHLLGLLSTENLKKVVNFDSPEAFYEHVANKLNEKYHSLPTKSARCKADPMMLPTNKPRTGRTIQLYHQDLVASKYKFSSRESDTIMQKVSSTISSGLSPDWYEIANELLVSKGSKSDFVHGMESEDSVFPPLPITPYGCMVHYKTKLSPKSESSLSTRPSASSSSTQPSTNLIASGNFSPEEDEFLLRYMAMMGPQFVWDRHQLVHLTSRLFGPRESLEQSDKQSPQKPPAFQPGKTPRILYDRTVGSIWNPFMKDTPWTKDEEKKLVLAMKIYHASHSNRVSNSAETDVNPTENTAETSQSIQATGSSSSSKPSMTAIRRTARHFCPARQAVAVTKKWDRLRNVSKKRSV